MKKYLSGIAAIVLAVSISSFTTVRSAPVETNLDSFFWYSEDGSTDLGQGTLPSNGCHLSGTGCAKGYTVEPANPQSDPPQIRVRS